MASTKEEHKRWDHEMLIDTERGIVIDQGNMNDIEREIYINNSYISPRPDYQFTEQYFFRMYWKRAENLLGLFSWKLDDEIAKLDMKCQNPNVFEHLLVQSLP